jgi:hypothetical protein
MRTPPPCTAFPTAPKMVHASGMEEGNRKRKRPSNGRKGLLKVINL